MTISAVDSAGNAALIQKLRIQLFNKVDTDRDGGITQAELEAASTAKNGTAQQADALFVALGGNADGSGTLSTSQVDAGLQQLFASQTQRQMYALQSSETPAYSSRLTDLFGQADTDGDGTVTQKELQDVFTSRGGTSQQADALFAALDPDGTGRITEDQFESGMQQLIEQARAAVAPPRGGDRGGRAGMPSLSDLFSQLTNGGDALTKSALEQAFASGGGSADQADALFDQLDADGSGSVSEDEFVSGMKKLMPPPGGPGSPASADGLSEMFQSLTGGSDTLTKNSLEQAFISEGGTADQADELFAYLDPDGDGSVTESEFVSGMQKLLAPPDGVAAGQSDSSGTTASDGVRRPGGGGGGSDRAQATTKTEVNPDGSVTTTVTYPDGTTVSTTTPAAKAAGASANAAATGVAGTVLGPVDSQTISALFVLLAA